MKNLFFPVAAIVVLAFAASCGNSSERNKDAVVQDHYYDSMHRADSLKEFGPPLDIEFSQATDKTNDGKRVTIIGYLDIPHNSYSTGKTGQLSFIERPTQMSGAFNFILSIPLGKNKNSMKELPDKYTSNDVIVTGKNGEKASVGDRVKLTGILRADETYCSLDVQEIEKLESVTIDYSTLNAAKITGPDMPGKDLDGKLVTVDGTLEMPMLSMGGELTFLYLHVNGIKDQLTVNIAYGTGPAKLEPLPENYADKDIKIVDSKGGHINMKKKVRLYGLWKNDRVEIEAVDNI